MLTDEQLKGIAMQSLNMAKLDLERNEFNFLFAVYDQTFEPKLHRMTKVEKLIVEKLGENWLNSGEAKDIGFGLFRMLVDLSPPEAIVFVTVCNMFTPTKKFKELTKAQRKKLLDGGHDSHHEAVKQGHLEVHDTLTVSVQTPERVYMGHQRLGQGEFIGQPELRCLPQESYGGRMKMYGEHYFAATE